jgi:hypothetical protein
MNLRPGPWDAYKLERSLGQLSARQAFLNVVTDAVDEGSHERVA